MYSDEIMVSDVLSEYYNDFLIESQRVNNLKEKMTNRFIVESNEELVLMINNKLRDKIEKISGDYEKIVKWWKLYMGAIDDLNNGFQGTVQMNEYYNPDYNEAKKILNENIE